MAANVLTPRTAIGLRIARAGFPTHTIYFPNVWEAMAAAADRAQDGCGLALVIEEQTPQGWEVAEIMEVA